MDRTECAMSFDPEALDGQAKQVDRGEWADCRSSGSEKSPMSTTGMDADPRARQSVLAPCGRSPMPLTLIQTVLGVAFALIWIFIGAMILRDGQFAVRREREESSANMAAMPRRLSPPRPHGQFGSLRSRTNRRRGTSAA
jgi:hypothetical protein